MLEWKAKDQRYFWTGWFTGQSYALLASLYVLLSAADLLATVRWMKFGAVKEGNPSANIIFKQYGLPGFIAYKAVLVAFVLLLIYIVEKRNRPLAHYVLWGANILMGFLAILHISMASAILTFLP
jgi:hypothetical protein